MAQLEIKDLCYSIDGTDILKNVSLSIEKGEFVGLVGPNGCGKSTLLKNVYRVYHPNSGDIFLEGDNIKEIKNKEFAQKMAVMVQENSIEFDLTVMDMVILGRYARKKLLQDSSKDDRKIAKHFLDEVGMGGCEGRSFLSLSGGEKQRVLLARALTQEAKMIVLDEPTNHLDIKYQYQIMNILKKQDITVFTSVHDLNIAAQYCDRIIVMKKGVKLADGTPNEIFTRELIRTLYDMDSEITIDPRTGRPQIHYIPEYIA
ncbi:Vitamin B12 ABC transporter, ATPase component BtuD [Lachnospiraceae bacterium TWA4]|nr:Vitamin B12 ABC transporter, ATPase component BtuD [Lachnospiraceae bacterium TWA4]